MVASWVASEANGTFFSISASSLTSKWIGESEKLVRTLFEVAREKEPAIIFVDEIDSLLTKRNCVENDSVTRQKTEFLLRFDGLSSSANERLLIIGATNRPQDLDEAARRRFTKRIYVPLPCKTARKQLIERLLKNNNHSLNDEDFETLSSRTEGFSGADINNLCKDAANVPIVEIMRKHGPTEAKSIVEKMDKSDLNIQMKHFEEALISRKPSVSTAELKQYEDWDREFGSK